MSRNLKMKQDLLASLPPEVTIDIFSRLPIQSIIRCKCVCKSWFDLIKSNEFVNSHLSKSVPGLALFQRHFNHGSSKPYKFLEFAENSKPMVFNLSFPHDHKHIRSSVNGLLFLSTRNLRTPSHFICNPVTRGCIKLPRPHKYPSRGKVHLDTFGFGVSKKSGQYKVVRIFHECIPTQGSDGVWKIDINEKCDVYTLGTGSWRNTEPSVPLRYNYDHNATATFLNGNLHWQRQLYSSSTVDVLISCFDLETELFTIFSAPPIHDGCYYAISTLEECLVFCNNSYDERKEIVIWFMNEYGDDKSWIKKFIIAKRSLADDFIGSLRPIKVFEDGDILITEVFSSKIFCYSSKSKTIEKTDLAELYGFDRIGAVSYAPSLVPLNTFTMENVSSLI